MFIRRTQTRSRQNGEPYFTYRLVESARVAGKVKQRTLLNLGRHFAVPKEQWPDLVMRIEQLLSKQGALLVVALSEALEQQARTIVAQLLARGSQQEDTTAAEDVAEVDLNSLELVEPRRVGVEQLALHAMGQLGFLDKLQELGLNRHVLAASVGNIIARMAHPASERATEQWLKRDSGLGELLDYDYADMKHDRLYQASDALWRHKAALESWLYAQERTLFSLQETITLFDLTNTFFEGQMDQVEHARRGRSKEKRSDCPLITMGLVLDGSGFPRRSELFPGNVSEPKTLQTMLERLQGEPGCTVIMDAGIATEDNISWLREQGFRYLVVSRKRKRAFDDSRAVTVKETKGQKVRAERVLTATGELELHCHSEAREKKEQAMVDSAAQRFEEALQGLHAGLSKKNTTKRYDKILERIGKLKEKYARVAQHYEVSVEADEHQRKALAVHWQRTNKEGSRASHPGVYCLRTNILDWDETSLWRTYTMLTDLESVFRSLKSELGLRPNYHHKAERVNGHLFISLLAYHFVHVIRTQLKASGIHDSWQTLRRKMENQQRVTVSLARKDGRTVHIRKATRPEPHQKTIYEALGVSQYPGGVQKTLV